MGGFPEGGDERGVFGLLAPQSKSMLYIYIILHVGLNDMILETTKIIINKKMVCVKIKMCVECYNKQKNGMR